MDSDAQRAKYDAKIAEFAKKISAEVNVDPGDVAKVLRHLGIEHSLHQRDVEANFVSRYRLPQGNTIGSDRVLVEQLRISSGPSPI